MFKVLYKVTSGPLCIISAKSIKQKRKADKLYVNSLSCVINCSPNCEQFIRHLNIWKKKYLAYLCELCLSLCYKGVEHTHNRPPIHVPFGVYIMKRPCWEAEREGRNNVGSR